MADIFNIGKHRFNRIIIPVIILMGIMIFVETIAFSIGLVMNNNISYDVIMLKDGINVIYAIGFVCLGGKLVAKLLDSKGKEIDNLTIKDTDKLDFKETVSCTNIINGLVRVCIFDKNNSYMVCTKIQDGFKDIYINLVIAVPIPTGVA